MRPRVILAFALSIIAAAIAQAEEPHGIRAKYATPVELSTTNLAPGELVLNTSAPSDLRVGDGGTPGGQSVGAWVMEALREDPDFLHDIGGATADETKAFLALSVANQRAGIAENAGNIHSNSAGLSWITNSMGQRISEFETVRLGVYPTNNAPFTWFVPTNVPTRELEVFINPYTLTSDDGNAYKIAIPLGFAPLRPMRVRLVFGTAPGGTNTIISTGFGASSRKRQYPRDGSIFEWIWMPEVNAWHIESYKGRDDSTAYDKTGTANTLNLHFHTTIDEWIEWRNQQPW